MHSQKIIVTFFGKAVVLACVVLSAMGNMDPAQEDFILDDVKWGLTNANKTETCILLNGIFQVMIPYESDQMVNDVTLLTVPRNASVTGTCGDFVDNVTLSWLPASGLNAEDPPTHSHTLTFRFVKRGKLVQYSNDTFSEPYFELDAVTGVFYAGEEEFPGFNRDKTVFTFRAKNLGILTAPVGLSYFCQATEVIESDTKEATLLLSLAQVEAFHVGLSDTGPGGIDFGPRSYCPKDGYRIFFTVLGFVGFLSLVGAVIFLVVNWLRPKRRADYWYL